MVFQKQSLWLLATILLFCSNPLAVAEEISFGTLRAFKQKAAAPDAPVVFIIPGSGPVNRDGDTPFGNVSTYRLLAEELAEKGIASVRADKRGLFSSASVDMNPNAVTIEDYASDVRGWIDQLMQEGGQECIWLLGHGEGGITALVTASQNQENICGLILATVSGRKVGDLMREQLAKNPANAELLPAALSAIDSLEQGIVIDTTSLPESLARAFRTSIQAFLMNFMQHDPVQLLSSLSIPSLILHGESDIHLSTVDAQNLHQANPKATLALLSGVTHVLKDRPAGKSQRMIAYRDSTLPISKAVIEAITKYVLCQEEYHYFSE